jgi:hypothetical protein
MVIEVAYQLDMCTQFKDVVHHSALTEVTYIEVTIAVHLVWDI